MTSRRSQRENRPDRLDVAALEHELHQKQRTNRQGRHADDRREQYLNAGAAAEAQSIANVTSRHFRGRPIGDAS